MSPWWLLLGGLVLLVVGAEGLVRGASRLGRAAGISPLAIGLVIVSLGTSAPEIAVSVGSAWAGNGALALGNVVGSNTFNVLGILGVSALVAPLLVHARVLRIDIPFMLGASLLLVLLALDGRMGRVDGAVLFLAAVGYMVLNLRLGRREAPPKDEVRPAVWWPILMVAVGLGLLVLGANWTLDGASSLARRAGVSDLVIGLTIVAAGTSLPELATSVLAAVRGERDIAIGNVVGSNVLNITFILGLSAQAPGGLTVPSMGVDLAVMCVAALLVLPIAFTGRRIARWEGALFVAAYAGYVGYLVFVAT